MMFQLRQFFTASLLLILLTLQAAKAATVTARLQQLTGKPVMGNTFVRFELKNCGINLPRVAGMEIVAPPVVDLRPNALGIINGLIINNNLITCDVLGNTYYTISVWNGATQIYAKDFIVAGATMDLTAAAPMTDVPTPIVPHFAYTYGVTHQGDIFWSSAENTMSLFSGNKTTTQMVLTQTGDGVNPGTPTWALVQGNNIDSVPTTKLAGVLQEAQVPQLKQDVMNTGGSADVTVIGIRGRRISTAVPTKKQSLVYNSTANQWEPQAIVNQFNGRTGSIEEV
jgi:hypothetical protein